MFSRLLIYFLKKPAVQETLVDIVMGYRRARPTPLIDERDEQPLARMSSALSDEIHRDASAHSGTSKPVCTGSSSYPIGRRHRKCCR